MFFQTIKSQLLALSVIPVIVLSIIFAVSYTIIQVNLLSRIHLDYGSTLVKNIGPSSEFGILTNNKGFLTTIAGQIVETSHATSVTLYDSEFNQLIEVGDHGTHPHPNKWPRLSDETETRIFETNRYSSFFAPIYISSTEDIYEDFQDDIYNNTLTSAPIGYIEITLSKSALNQEQSQVYTVATVGTLLLIIIFFIISSFTSSRIATPIKRLSTIVGEIKRGNLESRAELDATGEILDLQKGINSMSETLLHSRETMKNEILKATESLQNANSELANKNIKLVIAEKTAVDASNSKSQFLANMSHEIRTPLNGIIGFTDCLKKTELQQDQREQVDIIESCSKSLLNIINDILDFSKAESGNLQVNNDPLNLNNLIDEVINITTPDAHQKDLIIGYVIYDDVNPNIISDEQKIRHILTNLISNAIKFTETGSVELRVSLDENDNGDEMLLFSITDTGIGIDKEHQELIFHPFQQADASTTRSYGGTGLGLSISKYFAEMLEGTIEVESDINEGSTFNATIAYHPNNNITPAPPPSLNLNIKTLIYSESSLIRFKLSHLIKNIGGEVEYCNEMDGLNEIITQHSFELFIISVLQRDVIDHRIDTLINQINLTNPEAKILILLNSRKPEIIDKISPASNLKIISQPFSQQAFYHAVNRLIVPNYQIKADTSAHTSHDPFSLENCKILLVEDNEINSILLTTLLQQFDITPALATNGNEAITACSNQTFDLILMDLHMPGMDGRTATRIIKQTSPETPVIALTADVLVNQNELFNIDGFNGFIVKPIDEQKLIETLKKWLIHDQNITYQALQKQFQGKEKLAQEMYTMLIDDLEEKLPIIKQLWQQNSCKELIEVVHKINGSASYCGVDSLHQIASSFEAALSQNLDEGLDALYQNLINTIQLILQEPKQQP